MKTITFRIFTLLAAALLTLAVVLLSGCATQNKFNKQADKHKDWLAEKCVQRFPAVLTPGRIDTVYRPASNIDYTGKIDSLNRLVISLRDEAEKEYTVAPENCKPALDRLNARITGVVSELNYWKTMYEKCKPDTVTIDREIKVKDSAAEYLKNEKIKDLQDDVDKLSNKLSTRTKQRNGLFLFAIIVLAYGVLRILGKIKPL